MAEKKAPQTADEEWETIAEAAPTKVGFDTFGDVFIGIKLGVEEVTDPNTAKTWKVWLFTGVYPDELAGERCGVPGTYQLDNDLAKVPDGHETRIEYVKDVPTRQGNPLKSFTVKARVPKITAS